MDPRTATRPECPVRLGLSDKQQSALAGWRRPSEFMTKEPRMISVISPYSITQELVTDCSFVSSLCIAAAYERRRNKQLVTKIIYPQNRKGQPVYNPCGKYMVKLWLNGIARKVRVSMCQCVCYNTWGNT